MNNAAFGKTMENVRKHRDIKLVTRERTRNYLVSKPNFHATKFFTEYLLSIEMKKTKVLMNKSFYLGLSILKLSKILMYEEFWYGYVKPKYDGKAKVSLYIYKQMIFIKTLQKTWKLGLILQIMN